MDMFRAIVDYHGITMPRVIIRSSYNSWHHAAEDNSLRDGISFESIISELENEEGKVLYLLDSNGFRLELLEFSSHY